MKNIPITSLLDQLAQRTGGIKWADTVALSRQEAGQHTRRRSTTAFATDNENVIAQIETELRARGYVATRGPREVSGVLAHPTEDYYVAHVAFSLGAVIDHTVQIHATGDEAECQSLVDWFRESFTGRGSIIRTAARLDDRGHVEFDSSFIPEGTAQVARQSFYPWLGISLEAYYKAFMESDESVLVMYGPAGLAKTTFLRSLIASDNYNAMLAYNRAVVESPELIRAFHRSASARILAYEDIDRHLAQREDGNTLMASLLNAADGVVSRKGKKLVFITNLSSIDKIDSALLRVGRCFDILKFELLTPDQANAVRVDVGLEERDFSEKKGWTVAEALAKQSAAQQTINRFGNKIGF